MRHSRGIAVPGGAHVEVRESGAGEPLLLVQTALDPDELVPLSREPALADRYRVVDCRRRGYGASSRAAGVGSVARDAADCLAVLRALSATPAHVVGASYSAAVALELAATAPDAVASLTLIEPPPVHGPTAGEFRETCRELETTHAREGVRAALEAFTRVLGVRSWLAERAELAPAEAERIERDAETFFATDLPALAAWRFERTRATRHPVLYVGGGATLAWFAPVHAWALGLFPQAESLIVPDAGHTVAATHPAPVASAIAAFLGRHPISGP